MGVEVDVFGWRRKSGCLYESNRSSGVHCVWLLIYLCRQGKQESAANILNASKHFARLSVTCMRVLSDVI